MDADFKKPFFTRVILGGLFAAIIATVINLVYNYIYRSLTEFSSSEIINIFTIIVATSLAHLIAALIYFLLTKSSSKTHLTFSIFFLILIIICIVIVLNANRFTTNVSAVSGFNGLFIGIAVITGLSAEFLLPYFANHPKIWSEE
ncbi:MAG: hypothetical protein ACR2FN_13760 [Chitinophagaceae bacterium]